MAVDVQVFVDQVQAVLLSIVAQDVVLFVCVTQFHDLASDKVADAASDVDEGEAVGGDPETRLDGLAIFIDEVESIFQSVLHAFLLEDSLSDCLVYHIFIELKQVECLLQSQRHLAVVL